MSAFCVKYSSKKSFSLQTPLRFFSSTPLNLSLLPFIDATSPLTSRQTNTQASEDVKDCSDPNNSKYYVIVVQVWRHCHSDPRYHLSVTQLLLFIPVIDSYRNSIWEGCGWHLKVTVVPLDSMIVALHLSLRWSILWPVQNDARYGCKLQF